jgi:transposase
VLAPLVEATRRYVLEATKLQGDDIPVPVLAPGNGKTKTGRLWTYVRDDRPAGDTATPAVWFAYSPDRKGEHPQQQAACWAHVWRKFFDLDQAHASPIASEALSCIGQIYKIESEIRGRSPDERLPVRQARTRPLFDQMHKWMQATSVKLSRKSTIAGAIH